MSNKTVLVTGSNGLLGQKITDLIGGFKDLKLVATSRGSNRYAGEEDFTYVDMDLLDKQKVAETLQKYRPKYLINTAAMTNVDACESHPDDCRQINVDAVRNLISLSEELGIHLIQLSTDFIFDGEDGPYSEEKTPHPLSIYGETKLEAEEMLKIAKCPWTIIRTILVYGVISDNSRSNIVLWAKSALEKGDPIRVVNDQWRMPTLAEDLASACLLAVEKEATGIFHVSGEEMFAIHELVEAIADFWNLDKSIINQIDSATLNQAAARPKKTGFVLDKAKSELGFSPHTLVEGLKIVTQQLQEKVKS